MMAGLLCRVEPQKAVCQDNNRMRCATLSQTAAPHETQCAGPVLIPSTASGDRDAGRYFNHSLFAPELTGGIFSQITDHKAPLRTLSIAGYDVCVRPAVAASEVLRIVDLQSCRVDYYVFALEKIRI